MKNKQTSRFIELTATCKNIITYHVRARDIQLINAFRGHSFVTLRGMLSSQDEENYLEVKETPQEIIKLIENVEAN